MTNSRITTSNSRDSKSSNRVDETSADHKPQGLSWTYVLVATFVSTLIGVGGFYSSQVIDQRERINKLEVKIEALERANLSLRISVDDQSKNTFYFTCIAVDGKYLPSEGVCVLRSGEIFRYEETDRIIHQKNLRAPG